MFVKRTEQQYTSKVRNLPLSTAGSSYRHDLKMYFLQRPRIPGAEKQQNRMIMVRTAIMTNKVAKPWLGFWTGVLLPIEPTARASAKNRTIKNNIGTIVRYRDKYFNFQPGSLLLNVRN